MVPTKLNFKIYQGSTFKEVLRWESSDKGYATITGITSAAPVIVTSVGHGIPVGWRTKITNVVGMKEINSSDTYYNISATTENSITINSVNSIAYTAYTSGGILEFNIPNSLLNLTAKMQIRSKIDSIDIIKELTTENGGIAIDNTAKIITITISAADTALLTITSAVYSLELISGIEIYPFIEGSITVNKEVTR
jgi:hypothetical protein